MKSVIYNRYINLTYSESELKLIDFVNVSLASLSSLMPPTSENPHDPANGANSLNPSFNRIVRWNHEKNTKSLHGTGEIHQSIVEAVISGVTNGKFKQWGRCREHDVFIHR